MQATADTLDAAKVQRRQWRKCQLNRKGMRSQIRASPEYYLRVLLFDIIEHFGIECRAAPAGQPVSALKPQGGYAVLPLLFCIILHYIHCCGGMQGVFRPRWIAAMPGMGQIRHGLR